jgi:hypothetical protein
MRCFQCGGPCHPATGHAFDEETWLCGACARGMISWVKGHVAVGRGRRRGGDFYGAAVTSIRAGVFPAPGEEIDETKTKPLGAVAHSVERSLDKREAVGAEPTGPTK